MKVKNIVFFSNGNTCVFDENGEQIPQLQESWFRLFIELLRCDDIDFKNAEIIMPDNRKANILELENDDWNWEIN